MSAHTSPTASVSPGIRLLVVEGNIASCRAEHIAVGGVTASEGYAALLRELCPGARTDLVFPADGPARLPDGIALADYDGAALTGSALHLSQQSPEVTRQIELARALLDARIPVFGSCWGLQVLTVAAGGVVRRNPRGREIGIGRNIALNAGGRAHPMYAGKRDAFSAMTVHLDEVETLAPGATLLASNDHSRVQAVDFGKPDAPVWGVQYHPEYPLDEVAAIVRRTPSLVAEGFFDSAADQEQYAARLASLHRQPDQKALAWRLGADGDVLDDAMRTREVANWIECGVRPFAARRR